MANIKVPLRSEPIFDEFGQFTIRYNEYFESLTETVNFTTTEFEESLAVNQVQNVQLAYSLSKINTDQTAEVLGLTVSINQLNSKLAKLGNRLSDIEQLAIVDPNDGIGEIKKELAELRGLIASGS